MANINIVTDSSCDLPPELISKHGIQVVPLTVRFGTEEFVDGVNLTVAEFWKRCTQYPGVPQTAAPSPGAFENAFHKAAEGAESVICITLSGGLSATMQSAQLAAKSVADDISLSLIDSRSVTSGLGMMVLEAAELAESGATASEITDVVQGKVARTRVFAALDTLDNLQKGGRIGKAQAMLGTMLSVKPVIEIQNGAVESESKPRTRARSIQHLVDLVAQRLPVEKLCAMHGMAPDFEDLVEQLRGVVPKDQEIFTGEIGPVIGSHAGPGTLGVTFQAE